MCLTPFPSLTRCGGLADVIDHAVACASHYICFMSWFGFPSGLPHTLGVGNGSLKRLSGALF